MTIDTGKVISIIEKGQAISSRHGSTERIVLFTTKNKFVCMSEDEIRSAPKVDKWNLEFDGRKIMLRDYQVFIVNGSCARPSCCKQDVGDTILYYEHNSVYGDRVYTGNRKYLLADYGKRCDPRKSKKARIQRNTEIAEQLGLNDDYNLNQNIHQYHIDFPTIVGNCLPLSWQKYNFFRS